MVYCSAVDCTSNNSGGKDGKKDCNISFLRLPRDEKSKKVCLDNLKSENQSREENISLCSLHFEEDSLERDLKVEL